MEIKLPKWLGFVIAVGILLLLTSGILVLVIHTKTSFAKESMDKITSMGGIITQDEVEYSRGSFYDFLNDLCDTIGYKAEMGQHAYHVILKGEEFNDQAIILVNAIPHLKSLHLESSHITDKAFKNLHGSDLLNNLKLIKIKCTKKGLAELSRFKKLKNLTLVSLDYIKADDFDFVQAMQLESLTLRDIQVNPLEFSQRNKLPGRTKLLVEKPRAPSPE